MDPLSEVRLTLSAGPGQASIFRPHQRRWPDEIAGHLPVVFPRSHPVAGALVSAT